MREKSLPPKGERVECFSAELRPAAHRGNALVEHHASGLRHVHGREEWMRVICA